MATEEIQVIPPERPTTKRGKRQYSDRQRAQCLAVLDSLDGNLSAASRATGVPVKTLSDWRDFLRDDTETASLRSESSKSLSLKLQDLAHRLVDAAPKKIRKAGLGQVATAMDLTIKNLQLINGQPTSIHEERTVDSRQVLVLLQETLGHPDPAPQQAALNPATDTHIEG